MTMPERVTVAGADLIGQIGRMRLIALVFALVFSGAALAASSEWHETEGGRVRLVTAGLPDADGVLHGFLDIQLDPGWKTYWLEPGDAGVPPTLELAHGGTAELSFPPPEWHHDGTYDWAGYDKSVALPVTLRLDEQARTRPVEAIAFLGLCKSICIPLSANLAVDPASDPDNARDALALTAAQMKLPEAATSEFGIQFIRIEEGNAVFEASGVAGTEAELFLSGGNAIAFAKPQFVTDSGKQMFRAKVNRFQKPGSEPSKVFYTLKTPQQSASGFLPVH
ncbi:MAG: hypothetical protein KF874_05275 [Rhizobiaceae bacterium]|nr:hypothetical protein [Rhizobiaceae bacterium]